MFVVKADSTVEMRPVRPGPVEGDWVSIDQGLYPLGKIGRESISEIWRKSLGLLREEHEAGRYSLPICQTCRDWHRP